MVRPQPHPARRRFSPRRFQQSILIFCLFLAGCSSGSERVLQAYLNANRTETEQPVSVAHETVEFVIEPGTPARQIGQNLVAAGLIDDALLFEAYVRVNGLSNQLEAGTHLLAPSMTLTEIVTALQDAAASSISVTLPEGWRLEQMAAALSEAGALQDNAYLTQAQAGDLTGLDPARYPFLQARPSGTSLEGYLFPDTYRIPAGGESGRAMLARQLDAFTAKALPIYDQAVVAGETDLSLHTVLTLAAIVEREAVIPDERPAIAGVYLNRLAAGMKLDADPTVQYALGYQPESDQWWKTPVYLEEYAAVDSPYNTYLYNGLPPGPIANPGLASIRAVLAPEAHNYLYFVALPDGTGAHVFAATYDEQVENVARYLGGE
ncbi:MAG: endolytic transglycosylase MltG [Caldilineaceae bacterium]|nr:endolytic transglycosylase MltG [Caldilineaceae bacterium]